MKKVKKIAEKKTWRVKKIVHANFTVQNLHPVVLQILVSRGYNTAEKIEHFLYPDFERDLHDPFLFVEMEKVVARITKAQKEKEVVGIFGDHDVDGISGTTILSETLDELGIKSIAYIPDKHAEGHGISEKGIETFAKAGATLMLTVDCGVSNILEVTQAKKRGMDVIIIDHHSVPKVLPDAFAIINPQLDNAGYPFKDLCGTGAAFKVATALYRRLLPEKIEQLKWLLDIAAIGTIADVMPLYGENRTLTKYGLLVLSKTRRIAFQEMITVGRIPIDENHIPDARMIAFHIAPRLNAAGRMGKAQDAFDFLIEKDRERARSRALDLEAKNKERQKITDELVREVHIIAEEKKDKQSIIAIAEHFPIGIIGIVAGRMASQYGKPTGVFHKGAKESRGSFRSIPAVNIIRVLEKCSRHLVKFGGHHQAAGATITNKNFPAFEKNFHKAVEDELAEENLLQELIIDAEISSQDVDFALAQQIRKCAPFGQGNVEPLFLLRNLCVDDLRWVGNGNKHVKLLLHADGSPKTFDAIGFGFGNEFSHLTVGAMVDAVCTIEENEWNGTTALQLNLVDIQII